MTPAHPTLIRAMARIIEKIEKLEPHLDSPESWQEYVGLVTILATIAPQLVPGADGELLTTREMAARMNVNAKTFLKKRKKGEITPAKILGERGRAAFRWRAQ
jgi:hypothetical protein